MTHEEAIALLELIEQRDHIDLLYQAAKIVAETDSIGEGYGYCPKYKQEEFQDEINKLKAKQNYWNSSYLFCAALPIYKVYYS